MYFDQLSASRTWAPRIGTRLCMLCEQFSAMHSQPRSGKKKFISAGASVSGVSWNTMRTPSTTSSSPVRVMLLGRRDQAGRAERDRLAEPAVDVLARAGRQQRAELVDRAAGHGVAGDHVLADHLVQESVRGDHPATPGIDVGLAWSRRARRRSGRRASACRSRR